MASIYGQTLFLADKNLSFGATLRKRADNGMARITRGWGAFVKAYAFDEGDVFILSIREVAGHLFVRCFLAIGA